MLATNEICIHNNPILNEKPAEACRPVTRVFYFLPFGNSANSYTTPPPRQSTDFKTIFAAAKQDSLSLANKKSEIRQPSATG